MSEVELLVCCHQDALGLDQCWNWAWRHRVMTTSCLMVLEVQESNASSSTF